jgi:hypothetical protein
MPRRVVGRECQCGCEGVTRGGEFLPGHDQRLYAAIVKEVGGVVELRRIVEKALNVRINVRQ